MAISVPSFTIVLRGYDRREVDRAVEQELSGPGNLPAPRKFPVVMRGYDRNEVDAWFRTTAGSARGGSN